MIRKLHLQMTLFCTLITGIIMISLSVVSIVSYEVSLKNNEYATFINEINSMIANLENQSVISYEWIAKMEKNDQYILSFSNNGQELLYEQLKGNDTRQTLTSLAKKNAADHGIDFQTRTTGKVLTEHTEFTLRHNSKDYFVSAAMIPKGERFLGVLMIRSLDSLHSQIIRQRLLFTGFNLMGIGLLFVFSYFFTKRMIEPIRKNKEQQTQFVALASHELRTPLSVILSSLSAMDKADKKDAPRFKRAIETEGQRMSRLINDLLLLASADNSSFSMEFSKLELDTLLIDAFEKFDVLANKKGICLSIDLPDQKFPLCLGDRNRLEQVLSVLLDNAISYTPANGDIHLSMGLKKAHLEMRIADNGPGIPDSKKPYIWERFYRADESRTERKHFGLGLSIAKEIVKAHKGKIWVEDASGGGAEFVITLPFIDAV